MTTGSNDRKITARELGDKLDAIQSEQKVAHWRTRAWLVGLMAIHIGLSTFGVGPVMNEKASALVRLVAGNF